MESANSLERMLQVVDLIEASESPVLPDDLMARLDLTRSTLYRYLKTLSEAELITSFPGVGFALGPRIAELDFRMRNRDPLIIASRPGDERARRRDSRHRAAVPALSRHGVVRAPGARRHVVREHV